MIIEIEEKNDICPFNDFFYFTCFYNSMAPILMAYKIPISYVFGNAQYYYESVNELITVKYELYKPLDIVLRGVGITMHEFHGFFDLKQRLRDELLKNHPVIIFVDLFYLSYRVDEYEKVHVAHSILIIGLDDKREQVIAIEHSSMNVLDFRKMELSLSEIAVAHYEYVKRIDDFGFVACSFERGKKLEKKENKLENCLERESFFRERKIKSIDTVKKFKRKMESTRGKVYELEKDIIELNNNIQYILKAVRGEKKLLEMNGYAEKEMIILEECWNKIYNIIQYFSISKKYKEEKLELLILNLQKIIDLEERRLGDYAN